MFLSWLFLLFTSQQSQAYPEFIGHGYTTCLTCHWNGAGGGGLNDYGRALFATEIAAKPFGMGDDEDLAEWSGFLGKVKLPYWFKPGIKFRRLFDETDPGSINRVTNYYAMQNDLNLASFTGEQQTFGFVGTLSYVKDPAFAAPDRRIDNSSMMAREYYLRYQMNDSIVWYAGFMDKVYGIKTADHTAFNRSPIHLGQNDQVHGLTMQWQTPKFEWFVQPFLGNLSLPGGQQSRGITTLYEYEPAEKVRVGGSFRYEKNEDERLGTVAGHLRIGIGHGHALLCEVGFKQDRLTGIPTLTGAYDYLAFNYQLVRGLNFQSIVQYDKADFSNNVPDTLQWGLGFLYFPFQRMEWRFQAVQGQVHQDNLVRDDQWDLQVQLHLSL